MNNNDIITIFYDEYEKFKNKYKNNIIIPDIQNPIIVHNTLVKYVAYCDRTKLFNNTYIITINSANIINEFHLRGTLFHEFIHINDSIFIKNIVDNINLFNKMMAAYTEPHAEYEELCYILDYEYIDKSTLSYDSTIHIYNNNITLHELLNNTKANALYYLKSAIPVNEINFKTAYKYLQIFVGISCFCKQYIGNVDLSEFDINIVNQLNTYINKMTENNIYDIYNSFEMFINALKKYLINKTCDQI